MRPHTKGRLFFGGHSYGGRQVSILSAADPNLVDGLLLLSYPLHPPKKPSELRTVHFPEIRTPTLFVHGSRDGFGSIEEMAEAICLITARTELLPIEGSGHELMTKRNSNALSSTVVEAFRSFIK
jgi:predicted alpha/beta-hydrolase family hydrolase